MALTGQELSDLLFRIGGDAQNLKVELDAAGKLVFKYQKETDKTLDKTKNLWERHSKNLKRILAPIAGYFSFRYAIREIKELVRATGKQEAAEEKLMAMLKNVTTARKEDTKMLIKQAAALQNLTVFGDEEIINAQAILATFQLNGQEISKLTPRILDMASAMSKSGQTGMDLNGAVVALGKAYSSGLGMLSRYGVVISDVDKELFKHATTAEKTEILIRNLDANFKGAAETMGKTTLGAAKSLDNTMGDLKETFGRFITPLLQDQLPKMKDAISIFDDWVTSVQDVDKALDSSKEDFRKYVTDVNIIVREQMLSQTIKIMKEQLKIQGMVSGYNFWSWFGIGEKVDPGYQKLKDHISDLEGQLQALMNQALIPHKEEIEKTKKPMSDFTSGINDLNEKTSEAIYNYAHWNRLQILNAKYENEEAGRLNALAIQWHQIATGTWDANAAYAAYREKIMTDRPSWDQTWTPGTQAKKLTAGTSRAEQPEQDIFGDPIAIMATQQAFIDIQSTIDGYLAKLEMGNRLTEEEEANLYRIIMQLNFASEAYRKYGESIKKAAGEAAGKQADVKKEDKGFFGDVSDVSVAASNLMSAAASWQNASTNMKDASGLTKAAAVAMSLASLANALSAKALAAATLNLPAIGAILGIVAAIMGLITTIAGFEKGGFVSKGPGSLPKIPEAQDGLWYTGKGLKPIPAILHPNEIVLNEKFLYDFFGTMGESLFKPTVMQTPGGGMAAPTIILQVGAGNFDDPAYWKSLFRNKIKPAMEDVYYGML